jgi:hypothetical protein
MSCVGLRWNSLYLVLIFSFLFDFSILRVCSSTCHGQDALNEVEGISIVLFRIVRMGFQLSTFIMYKLRYLWFECGL